MATSKEPQRFAKSLSESNKQTMASSRIQQSRSTLEIEVEQKFEKESPSIPNLIRVRNLPMKRRFLPLRGTKRHNPKTHLTTLIQALAATNLARVGRNSAKISNGTVSPPTLRQNVLKKKESQILRDEKISEKSNNYVGSPESYHKTNSKQARIICSKRGQDPK